MTELQVNRANALKECRLPTFGSAKRFIEHMALLGHNPDAAIISPKQDKALEYYAWHFRDQLRAAGQATLVPIGNPHAKNKVEQFEMKLQ